MFANVRCGSGHAWASAMFRLVWSTRGRWKTVDISNGSSLYFNVAPKWGTEICVLIRYGRYRSYGNRCPSGTGFRYPSLVVSVGNRLEMEIPWQVIGRSVCRSPLWTVASHSSAHPRPRPHSCQEDADWSEPPVVQTQTDSLESGHRPSLREIPNVNSRGGGKNPLRLDKTWLHELTCTEKLLAFRSFMDYYFFRSLYLINEGINEWISQAPDNRAEESLRTALQWDPFSRWMVMEQLSDGDWGERTGRGEREREAAPPPCFDDRPKVATLLSCCSISIYINIYLPASLYKASPECHVSESVTQACLLQP